jgi:hypothetical protein
VRQACPESIHRAFAIDPPPGSTYLDAEHVVILMQNRLESSRASLTTINRLRPKSLAAEPLAFSDTLLISGIALCSLAAF